jgi:hypothetical protein
MLDWLRKQVNNDSNQSQRIANSHSGQEQHKTSARCGRNKTLSHHVRSQKVSGADTTPKRNVSAHRHVRHREGRGSTGLLKSMDPWIFLVAFTLILYRVHCMIYSAMSRVAENRSPFRIPVDPSDAQVIGNYKQRLTSLSVEIFSAPKPFVGADNASNRRAIESWKKLNPTPKITLLGNEVGYLEAANHYGLTIENRVDKTFIGIPMFNSMIDRANRSKATIAVVINGDILLYDDFMQTLRKVVSSFQDFLLVGARYDIDELPAVSDYDLSRIRPYVVKYGKLHTYGGMDGEFFDNSNSCRLTSASKQALKSHCFESVTSFHQTDNFCYYLIKCIFFMNFPSLGMEHWGATALQACYAALHIWSWEIRQLDNS